MRLIGSDHPKSKWIEAFNPKSGIKFRAKGVRAVTASIWGKTPAGVPCKVSSVISICNGVDKRDNLEGWFFTYIEPPVMEEEEDVLASLGI